MSLRDSFKTSPKLETEGVLLELGNTRIRVARAGGSNQKYNAAMERISAKHQRAITHGLLENKQAMAILHEVYADHIILDWETRENDEVPWQEGIEGPNGDIIPATKENIIATFKELPDLFLEIKSTAESIQFFRQSILDDAVKN